MNDISTFSFDSNSLRVVIRDGEPWFVAADVAAALGISRTDDAVSRLDDDEKGADSIRTPGGQQEMTVINESGLYSLILTSRKPEAKKFKKWVTSEVLPTIRKTGSYISSAAPTTTSKQQDDLLATEIIARMLNFSESGKVTALRSVLIAHNSKAVLALPAYVVDAPPSSTAGSSEATGSLTELLKEQGIEKSARAVNTLLEKAGILCQLSRKSRKPDSTEIKKFWSISEAGLEFGKNVTNPSNPLETQPHWYRSKFDELLKRIDLN